jgi:ATP-dependent Clp protease ATP-binding subunit ClpC
MVMSGVVAPVVGVRAVSQMARQSGRVSAARVAVPVPTASARLSSGFVGMRMGGNAVDALGMGQKVRASSRQARARKGHKMVTKAMFERFTEKAIKVVMLAQEEARRLGHNFVGTEQILLGLIGEGTGISAKVLKSMGVNLKEARVEVEKIIGRGSGFVAVEIPFTPRAKRVLELSLEEARQLGHNYIGTEHLLLGLLREGEGVAARVLENLGADPAKIRTQVIRMVGESAETVGAGVGGGQAAGGNKTPTLEEYGTDLTKRAEEGGLDPVVGRAKEIERVTQILGRRTKNNPILIGEPGVGKTAIAEGLAQLICAGDVPETIEGKKVITLDMGLLVAGTKYRGEFEERLKKLMDEIKQADDIILMIDEVHTLIGAGAAEGAIDAANILKPALARGELQCIGATTLDEYRKHIEKDPALERRFQPVQVPEPSVEECIQIIGGLRERYESHHKLTYTDEALEAAAKLAHQFISDRFLPDKAIDLMDEAGSRVRLRHAALPEEARELDKELKALLKEKDSAVRGQDFEKAGQLRDREMELKAQISTITAAKRETDNAESEGGLGPVVTETDIAQIVAAWTGIPVEKVGSDESAKLLKMEEVLHQRIIGQEEAVVAISRAVRRARVGLKNPNRPIASFIFSGPTGVGKSELCKALASYYFGSEEAMVRLDMSEFMERHTVSKLIGSPPGYVGYNEGGQLTEAVRRRPYTVVLFDEIEKAHPDVFNMMLQILEDGRLTDSKGRTVDFKNTLIIMTSNVGSSVIEKGGGGLGFQLNEDQESSSYNRIKTLVNEELKQYFRPEFLNRLDEIIVFRQLTKMEVKQIADIMLNEVFKRMNEKGMNLSVTERFKDRLVDEGFSPAYGARPLRRAIMRMLEDCLAERMLAGEIKEGDTAIMDVDNDGNITVLNGQGVVLSGTAISETPAGIA